jgi:hypothetical protein
MYPDFTFLNKVENVKITPLAMNQARTHHRQHRHLLLQGAIEFSLPLSRILRLFLTGAIMRTK